MATHTKQPTNIRWYIIINMWKFHYGKTYQTNKQKKTNKKTKQKTNKKPQKTVMKYLING